MSLTTRLPYIQPEHMDAATLSINGGVAYITLNRPDKRNAFNRAMALLVIQHLDECKTNPNVRCIVIRGAGKAFSAGQDLAEVLDPNGPGLVKILTEHYNPLVKRIREMPKPVVAAVSGVAAGASANLALWCDIVIASASASFIQSFSRIGLIPDTGGTYILPRLIGWQRASALMMLGEPVSAEEAQRIGMIYKAVPDEEFEKTYETLAATLAKMPTAALGLTKKALNDSFTNDLDYQLQLEMQLQQAAASTADSKEGVSAFLQKRQPLFTGS
jgi:2-(1,2-epoxy-1,2-dihydrophenyl)acetyl-CoA isomerase